MARRRNRTARWMARGFESAICLAISRVGVYHANGEFAAGELAHVIGAELLAEFSTRLGRDLATAPARLKMPPKVLVTKRRRLLSGRLRPCKWCARSLAVPGGATEADGQTQFGLYLAAMRRLHLVEVALSEKVIRRDRVLLLRLLRDDTWPHGGRQNVSVWMFSSVSLLPLNVWDARFSSIVVVHAPSARIASLLSSKEGEIPDTPTLKSDVNYGAQLSRK
ncbi:hypothetical protein LR48_Vigan01g053900 [Vigna angularis]|uniref:Uncharacterized protein n=1 Tax=Phaseolus angularis TaxID=3914 RepID=A0A0L9TLH5_PHAAN|nr:hypothetical protein LR48_Vigan01g053900 [Vigna angularis]